MKSAYLYYKMSSITNPPTRPAKSADYERVLAETKNVNYEMEGGRSYLDPEKLRLYFDRWGTGSRVLPYKKFVMELVKATKYVPFVELYSNLLQSFLGFKAAIGMRPFKIIVDCKKFGSEFWFMHLLYPFLISANFKGVYLAGDPGVENVKDFLIIDDCIYTGSNIYGTIEEIITTKPRLSKAMFHVCVGFCQSTGKGLVESVSKNVQIYFTQIIPDNVAENIFVAFFKKDRQEFEEYMSPYLEISSGAAPIYFDHKVAGEFSSYPSIYLDGFYLDDNLEIHRFGNLTYELPSRHKITEVANIYKEYRFSNPCNVRIGN